jgi:hypothetical protein
MLLTSVLRAWLKGEDPNLARTMSAIVRAGAWAAARRLPRQGYRIRCAIFRRRPGDGAAPTGTRSGHSAVGGPKALKIFQWWSDPIAGGSTRLAAG